MPEEGVKLLDHSDIISYEQITEVAKAASRLGFSKIRITGGEPLVRKGIVDLVSMLSGIEGITMLAMTTNGTLLENFARELKTAGLTRINVSLDTLDPALYKLITRGGLLDSVLSGIEAARTAGLTVKINTVVLDGTDRALLAPHAKAPGTFQASISTEQGVEAVRAYAASIGADFQRIAQYHLSEIKKDYADFERPPACASCNRLRLLANGTLRPCLHSGLSIPVDFTDIEGSIQRAIGFKPARGQECGDLEVGQIGG
jgi:cyclic pyranopterin phosphate synthase